MVDIWEHMSIITY